MKVWVYVGQHDLQIDVMIFVEEAEKKARKYARAQKTFFKKRLIYTLDLMNVIE